MGLRRQLTRRIVWRRLAEPSTWAGIVAIATALLGVTVSPEEREHIIAAGVAIMGALSLFVREASPGQVAKSARKAVDGSDPVDTARVRETIEVARGRQPAWHDRPARDSRRNGTPYPVSNDDPS